MPISKSVSQRVRPCLPVVGVALIGGAIFASLLYFLRDSIAAWAGLRSMLAFSEWPGVEGLFLLNAGLMGWLTVYVAGRCSGTTGFWLLLPSLPSSLGATLLGFAIGAAVSKLPAGLAWQLGPACAFTIVIVSVFRAWIDDIW